MKRGISFCGIRFGGLHAIVFFSTLLIMVSCKSEEVKQIKKFIGEFDVYFDLCDNSSLNITTFGRYLEISERKTGGKDVELLFHLDKNTFNYTETWYGNISNDTLFIFKQTPAWNDIGYKPTYTVSGYGVIREDSIKFAVDQQGASTRDGVCTFSAKRK